MISFSRAIDETRTRDLHLGKVAYYQLYYYRIFCICFCFVFLGTIHIIPYRNGFVNRFHKKNYVALFPCFSLFFRTLPVILCHCYSVFSPYQNRLNSLPHFAKKLPKPTPSAVPLPFFSPYFPCKVHRTCEKAAPEKAESPPLWM